MTADSKLVLIDYNISLFAVRQRVESVVTKHSEIIRTTKVMEISLSNKLYVLRHSTLQTTGMKIF